MQRGWGFLVLVSCVMVNRYFLMCGSRRGCKNFLMPSCLQHVCTALTGRETDGGEAMVYKHGE